MCAKRWNGFRPTSKTRTNPLILGSGLVGPRQLLLGSPAANRRYATSKDDRRLDFEPRLLLVIPYTSFNLFYWSVLNIHMTKQKD